MRFRFNCRHACKIKNLGQSKIFLCTKYINANFILCVFALYDFAHILTTPSSFFLSKKDRLNNFKIYIYVYMHGMYFIDSFVLAIEANSNHLALIRNTFGQFPVTLIFMFKVKVTYNHNDEYIFSKFFLSFLVVSTSCGVRNSACLRIEYACMNRNLPEAVPELKNNYK